MTHLPLGVIAESFARGNAIPYIGPGVLALKHRGSQLPGSPLALAGCLTSKSCVPFKIKNNLTAAAQFI